MTHQSACLISHLQACDSQMKTFLCLFVFLLEIQASLFKFHTFDPQLERDELQSFALKIAKIDENSLVTPQDLSLLNSLGFKSIQIAFYGFPFAEGETSTTWKEIFAFCKRVESSATLQDVIAWISHLTSEDQLKRKEFLSLYNLYAFLRADPVTMQSYKTMKFLSQNVFGSSVKNSMLVKLAKNVHLSSSSVTMNLASVYLEAKEDSAFAVLLKKIFSFYSKETGKFGFMKKFFFSSSNNLEKISIQNLPGNQIYDVQLAKMIESNCISLVSLRLSNVGCNLPVQKSFIAFPEVRDVEIRASKLHSPRINWIFRAENDFLCFNVDFPIEQVMMQGEFHLMHSLCNNSRDSTSHFIINNPNIKVFASQTDEGEKYRDAIKSLTALKYLETGLNAKLEAIWNDKSANSLQTLILTSDQEDFNWKLLLTIDNLKHFELSSSTCKIDEHFFHFCKEAKQLQVLSLPKTRISSGEKTEFFRAINKLPSLKVLAFKVDSQENNSAFSIDNIDALFIEYEASEGNSTLSIPSGKKIKFLQINMPSESAETIDFSALKSRFPTLQKVKVIGSNAQSEEFEVISDASVPIYPGLRINGTIF